MRVLLDVMISFFTAFCLVSAAGVVNILYIAFTGVGDTFSSTGLFGSVFFQSSVNERNNIEAQFGINDPVRLAIVFGIVFVICLLIVLFYRILVAYKKSLGEA